MFAGACCKVLGNGCKRKTASICVIQLILIFTVIQLSIGKNISWKKEICLSPIGTGTASVPLLIEKNMYEMPQ